MNDKRSLHAIWGQIDYWLGPIKPIFDIAVILVMVLTLRSSQDAVEAAHNANELTRQALRTNYVPWIKLIHFSIDHKGNDSINLNFGLKNFSANAPAVGLTVRSIIPRILDEKSTYVTDALMPGEEGVQTLTITGSENKATVDAIQNGTLSIRINIFCADAFGTQYGFEQEFRKIGDSYRITEYVPKGIVLSISSQKR